MDVEPGVLRILGAAQLFVFIASLLSERLLASVVGTGQISELLVKFSRHGGRVRISSLVALFNSGGIIVLGASFYIVFHQQYPIVSLVALGWFLAEGITLAASKVGTYALIPLGRNFIEAGSPETSHYQTLGEFLYHGVDRMGYEIHMLFFCLGGILWYALLFVSRVVPAGLALWGLAAVSLLTLAVLLVLYDRKFMPAMVVALLYFPFEPVLGVWLIFQGFV